MGLKVNGSFTTSEGLSYPSAYVKLHTAVCEFVHNTAATVNVSAHFLIFLNRDRRSQGFEFAMKTPPFNRILGVTLPTAELESGFLAAVYSKYKTVLTEQGFTVEDILEPTPEVSPQSSESTPPTLPTPPPPEEPPAASPEPQPQPSSAYAPAPAATEA